MTAYVWYSRYQAKRIIRIRFPARIAFDVTIDVKANDRLREEQYASVYDLETNRVGTDAIGSYQRSHPVVPKGFNVYLNLGGAAVRISKEPLGADFFGTPFLSPEYTFGLGRTGTEASATSGISTLRDITTVVADADTYRVTLQGRETIEGHDWLRAALNFVRGPGTMSSWLIDFAELDGRTYIAAETSESPMRYNGVFYASAAVRFSNIRETSANLPILPLSNDASHVLIEP